MDNTAPQPWKEGVVAGSDGASFDRPPITPQKVPDSVTLAELAVDHDLLTPGLVYSVINLAGRDPLLDYLREDSSRKLPLSLTFERAIFSGMERWSAGWNHTLLAMPKPSGDDFVRWMGQLSIVDRHAGVFYRVRHKIVPVVDVLQLARKVILPDPLPTVPVTVLCLDTSKGCYTVEPQDPPRLTCPPRVVVSSYVFDETRDLAKAILSKSPDPLKEVNPGSVPDLPSA